MSSRSIYPRPSKIEIARLRVVGVDVDLERRLVTHHEYRIADFLELRNCPVVEQLLAGDDEVDAVAVLRFSVVDVREAGRREVLDLRQLHRLAGERRQGTPNDHDEPERSGVDNPCLGENLKLLRSVPKRLLAGEQSRGEHLASSAFCSSSESPAVSR